MRVVALGFLKINLIGRGMNKIGRGCFDKQDTQAQTADPVKKWSIKTSAAGDGFFSCIHPRKKEGESPSFFYGVKKELGVTGFPNST